MLSIFRMLVVFQISEIASKNLNEEKQVQSKNEAYERVIVTML